MRNWTLFVITFAFLGGLTAATWVVATHEPTLTPAQAAGLIPNTLDYRPGRTPGSIEEMEKALRGPAAAHFIWWTYLGEMHHAAGNPERAREAWAEGARLARLATNEDLPEQDRWLPWYRLGWCEMRLGNDRAAADPFYQAARLLEQEFDRSDNWIWSRLFLGFAHRHLGSEDLARDTWREGLDRLLASQPRSPADYHYHAGRFLELLGDREGALRAFRAGAANHGFWRNFGIDWTPALEEIRRAPEFRALREIERSPDPVWLPEFAEAAKRWQRSRAGRDGSQVLGG